MVKKSLSRDRGRRPGQEEVERMVALYLQGKSFKAIAKETGRHWQTVRKYTIAALQEREGREVRQGALKEALVGHFEDLVGALGSLKGLLVMPGVESRQGLQDWARESPERRDRLLLQALRDSHAKESPLWGWWDRWVETREAYDKALAALGKRIAREKARLGGSPAVSLTEAVDLVLSRQALFKVKGLSGYAPGILRVCPHPEVPDREQLQLGRDVLAEGMQMEDIRVKLLNLARGVGRWPVVKELARLHSRLAELKAEMEEEIEVLSLRRAFPRHCRLCPV